MCRTLCSPRKERKKIVKMRTETTQYTWEETSESWLSTRQRFPAPVRARPFGVMSSSKKASVRYSLQFMVMQSLARVVETKFAQMRCEFHCDRSPCDGANLYNGVMLDGTIHPDYADVASTLIRQIPRDRHGGSAVCVYHRGRSVVDIWGGAKNGAGEPWARDTTAPSFSTTKGVLSTLLHILVDRGKVYLEISKILRRLRKRM